MDLDSPNQAPSNPSHGINLKVFRNLRELHFVLRQPSTVREISRRINNVNLKLFLLHRTIRAARIRFRRPDIPLPSISECKLAIKRGNKS